jgi:Carboxypeptidase regulatory-like domain
MKRTNLSLRFFCSSVVLGLVMLTAVGLASRGTRVWAEAQRGPTQRIVQGKVVSEGAPVNGAVVYLKDDHSLAVKSYITDSDGQYRFGQLSATSDYEVWAESNGKKSSVKSISSFDSKNTFYIDLKIDK